MPESTTMRTPSMVSDVSAIEVASTTLRLTVQNAGPAQTAHLHLADALGRVVWRASVVAGQTAVVVPLAGQPAGFYLLHLNGPDGTVASWKLNHE